MLRFLRINRLAVIESVEVELDAGLNVLTGETGAGKSILVEAVGLLAGGRASADLVRTGADTASVEAIFECGGEEFLVRREVTSEGRSRAFINGALASAGALKELSVRLIEIHGQHEHQTLRDPSTHLRVLDEFGDLEPLVAPVSAAFDSMRAAEAGLAEARRTVSEREARQDLLTFQLGELERAALKPDGDEDEELAALRRVLMSAERVERLCTESYASLYESDDAILARLGAVWRHVAELATLDPKFQPYLEAREGVKAQLEDLAAFLRQYREAIEASPAQLQQVEERLALLERLKRKYGPSLRDVLARREALRLEQHDLRRSEDRIRERETQWTAARAAYVEAAGALSKARRRVATGFANQLERLLGELAMEQTRFDVRFADDVPDAGWTSRGFDAAEFFVSPNPGEDLRPLARVVSGGELSRIMLAIKTLTFSTRLVEVGGERLSQSPGLIFDEVDAGIGGRVADVVGRKLRTLGSAFQVLCITHLPQIAAYADRHIRIDKRIESERTYTTVSRLDNPGRVEELARMLGGEAVSESVRSAAREMLAERGEDVRRKSGRVPLRQEDAGAKGEDMPKGESETRRGKRWPVST
ncbi:MAG: DNA repair protein RecN [Vicinamibacterales bacterium]